MIYVVDCNSVYASGCQFSDDPIVAKHTCSRYDKYAFFLPKVITYLDYPDDVFLMTLFKALGMRLLRFGLCHKLSQERMTIEAS